jgi:argininosuccinate lyase
MAKTNQSWGGRFTQPTDEFVQFFNASIDFDKLLAPFDIAGSIAHATMLSECGIILPSEKDIIIKGLEQVLSEIESGDFKWSYELEDVHMNVEARLVEIVGDTGKKLHTGRSRNDQVATDIRLYLRDKIDNVINLITSLQSALVDLADKHTSSIMPGFTHLQAAQPISFAHHLMAYYEMLKRDKERFENARIRTNTMPLGSAALAGTTYPIDRKITAKLLGFDRICDNSLDAVSDRDFAIEFLSSASILMMHLISF